MKISQLLRSLLFGLNFHSSVVEDGAGGDAAAIAAAAAATLAATEAAAATAATEAAAAAAALAANGGVKPTDAEAKLLKEVMKKKEALTASEAALTAATARLKEFEGIDPVAIRALVAKQAAAETAALEAAGNWEALRTRMAAEHTTSSTADKAEIATLKAALAERNGTIDNLSIGTQFAQSTFLAEETVYTPADARVIYASHFDLVDGAVVGFDKPRGEAKRTAYVDALGNNVGFDAALRKIVDGRADKASILKSKVKVGADSNSGKGKPVPIVAGKDSLSKIQAGLAGLKINPSVA